MQQQVPTRAFHVMAKPSGSDCNLNCDYCFYLENNPFTTKSQSRIWTMTRWKRMSVTISLPAKPKTKWLYPAGRRTNVTRAGVLPPCRGATGEIWCWQEDK